MKDNLMIKSYFQFIVERIEPLSRTYDSLVLVTNEYCERLLKPKVMSFSRFTPKQLYYTVLESDRIKIGKYDFDKNDWSETESISARMDCGFIIFDVEVKTKNTKNI